MPGPDTGPDSGPDVGPDQGGGQQPAIVGTLWPIPVTPVKGSQVTFQSMFVGDVPLVQSDGVLTLPDGTDSGVASLDDGQGHVQVQGVDVSVAGLWTMVCTSNDKYERTYRPVCYIDMYHAVLHELNLQSEDVPQYTFYSLFAPLMAAMLIRFSSEVPSYDGLIGSDAYMFDNALACLGAAWIGQSLPTSMDNTGEVQSAGAGPDRVEFFRKSAAPRETSYDVLIDKAWTFLLLIPAFAAEWDQLADQSLFVASGRRTALRKRLGESSCNPLYSLYFDEVIGQQFGGRLYELVVERFGRA